MSKNKYEEVQKLVNLGWPILPIWSVTEQKSCGCGKPECSSQGKHPVWQLTPNGLKNATCDIETIKQWLSGYPDMNIGIRTGSDSGLLVLDVDPIHSGDKSLVELQKVHGHLPKTVSVKTGSGGFHYYFKHPSIPIKNSAGKLGAGLDIKSDGGYIIVPPSLHKSGNHYEFINSPETTPLAAAPDWLLKKLNEPQPKDPVTALTGGGSIKVGQRNNELFSISGYLRNRGLEQPQIFATLLQINESCCRPPLPEKEVERIAKSISNYPVSRVERPDYNLTDTGNAERLVDVFSDNLRYDFDQGKWFDFDGQRWNSDLGEAKAVCRAVDIARIIKQKADKILDEKRKGIMLKFALKSEKHSSLSGMLKIGRCIPPISCNSQDFDKDSFKLNCLNGTLNLKTGTLEPHNPDDNITKLAHITYDQNATCPLWLKCLNEWMLSNQEDIDYLQRLGGVCLTGDTSSRFFSIFHGAGNNGKSVFADTLMEMLGDYATVATDTLLAVSSFSQHPTEIADLCGRRLVVASESKKNMQLRTSLIKTQTGDSKIKGRFMRCDLFSFTPTHKLILMTQNLPDIGEVSDGIWDRLHCLPWRYRVPDDLQDNQLMEKLKNEWPGILNWLVQGCLKWLADGRKLKRTASINASNEIYRSEEDPVKEFIETFFVKDAGDKLRVKSVRKIYNWWYMNNEDARPLSPTQLNRYLREKGFEYKTYRFPGRSFKVWAGLSIKPEHKKLLDDLIDGETKETDKTVSPI